MPRVQRRAFQIVPPQRRPQDARAVHAGDRGFERHRVGADGTGAALRHRAAADGAHRGLPAAAVGLLDAAHPRRYPDRPERHRPYRPRGTGHQPISEPVHRAGVHHRHRQPCGSGHRHPFRRSGGSVLDVGHGAAGHDDQLRRERAGHLLPPQRPGGRLARRANVLPAGWPWRQAGAGAGGAVCCVLRAGKLWHRQPEPAQFHRGQSAGGFWRAGGRHRRSAGGSIGR